MMTLQIPSCYKNLITLSIIEDKEIYNQSKKHANINTRDLIHKSY